MYSTHTFGDEVRALPRWQTAAFCVCFDTIAELQTADVTVMIWLALDAPPHIHSLACASCQNARCTPLASHFGWLLARAGARAAKSSLPILTAASAGTRARNWGTVADSIP